MALKTGIKLQSMRIGALLNTSSGSCGVGADKDLQAALAEAGLQAQKVWCGGAKQIEDALGEVADHSLDLLIVLGGDGTIRSAAGACTEDGPLLVPLPGGTMNMLPKALYGELSWQAALQATLKDPMERSVSGGSVDGHRFYVAAIFGSPSLWAEAREAAREGDLGRALSEGAKAMANSFNKPLGYSFGGKTGEAEALSVLCPLTSRAMADDDRALEAAVMTPKGAVDAIALGFRALFTEWRDDPNVETARVRSVDLKSAEPISAILDGETVELGPTAHVDFIPTAFRALVPAR